jgi:lipopolysaccharide transport system ATP-binding protein
MSSDTIITVENLSKRYVIGHQRSKKDGLRHAVEEAVRRPFKWLRDRSRQKEAAREEFWALKDVSFEVKQGDVVGIIGRNGAGKSTLLKLLSRITEPTSGRISLKGRVASLLEVGTGFHQELTGRENIYLNGAILGMSRSEIRRKFDEIVAFSEVEKFLDMPVKRYSSGMYVRLAFAVAAHMEPDILVIDEVLAVGDSAFQQKCLGKIDEVSTREGRTVLFVSHNMGVISRLCKRTVLLESGKLRCVGATADLISQYLSSGAHMECVRTWANHENTADRVFVARTLRVRNISGRFGGEIDITKPLSVEFSYRVTRQIPRFRVSLRFLTADGSVAFHSADSTHPNYDEKPTTPGDYVTRCIVPGNLLNEGQYWITVSADVPFQQTLFVEESAVAFTVAQTGGVNSRFSERWPGAVCPQLEWQTEGSPQELATEQVCCSLWE